MEYELVHEIKNHCPNNQMRDIFFREIETDDPAAWVRSFLKGTSIELQSESAGDNIVIHALCDGITHVFTFTAI